MAKKKTTPDQSLDAALVRQQSVDAEARVRQANAERDQVQKKYEAAQDQIAELEQALAVGEKLAPPKKVSYPKPAKGASGDAAAVVVLCDWHAEERVDPATINDINAYDLSVFDARAKKVFPKAVELLHSAMSLSKINELFVFLLGDFISGYIHDELEEGNEQGPVEAIETVRDHLVDGLEYLVEHSGISPLRVVANWGNHARMTHRPRVATGYKTNLEWGLYQRLAKRHHERGAPVHWQIAKGYHNRVDIKGWKVRTHHGNMIGHRDAIGGISTGVVRAIQKWNKGWPADYDVFGHWHQFKFEWSWVSCPSLIGYNAYAEYIKAEPQPPMQAFLVFDRMRGLVQALPVFVEGPK